MSLNPFSREACILSLPNGAREKYIELNGIIQEAIQLRKEGVFTREQYHAWARLMDDRVSTSHHWPACEGFVMSRKRRLNDLDKYKIELLVKVGGFSYRCIADQVLGVDPKSNSHEAVLARKSIAAYAYSMGIGVQEWRDGRNLSSQQHMKALLRIRKDFERDMRGRKRRTA